MDAQGINDWTPAHQAAIRNDIEALQLLHHAGADFSIRTGIDNYGTPLEEARLREEWGHAPNRAEAIAYLETLGD